MEITRNNLDKINSGLADMSAEEILLWAYRHIPEGKLAFASSFGAEDQVLTDLIVKHTPGIPVFTLDTGRLFQETYDTIEATYLKYKIRIEVLFPAEEEIREMIGDHGPNLFYYSVENRRHCCGIRKVNPLKKKLASLDAWITGLRRSQSVTRVDAAAVEWDETNGLIKINPLVHWSEEDVWQYIQEHRVPYNKLHDKGFPSIGCQPCTRAVEPGEDIRSGRWWWENPENRECGLHPK